MILTYEFTYFSKNGALENFLDNIAKDSSIKYSINTDSDRVFLHVEEDNEEKLLEFSNTLSALLPVSVFLVDTKIYVSEELNEKAYKVRECENRFSFTPKSLKTSINEFNPFIKNEVGANINITPPLVLSSQNGTKKFSDSYQEAFLSLADEIIENGANIKTTNGTFFISLINEKNFSLINDGNFFIMPTDLSVVDKMFIIEKEEIVALASLEKPALTLPTNTLFSSKNGYMPKILKVSLANDLFLQLLSTVLFKKNIEFVFISKQQDKFLTLGFNDNVEDSDVFEVTTLKNGRNIVTNGLKYTSKHKIEKIKNFSDKSYTFFISLLDENSLFEDSCCGFFLSEKYDDKIMFYSEKSGVLDFVCLEYEKEICKIFEKIGLVDENSAKLIENYKKNFSSLYENAINISLNEDSSQNFYNLFAIIALLLGFGEDLESARRKFIENFSLFGGVKGPRFDYKLKDTDSLKTTFDAYKLIRSALSYKLAGVDDMLLSYGLLESLVFFLCDTTDSYKDNFDVKNVAFFGSFFRHKTFSNLCLKHFSPNYKVNFNKELPIEF